MRTALLALPLAAALAGSVTPALAGVDCNAVNQQIKGGRWAVDVAESMGLTLAQVNDCAARSDAPGSGKVVPARQGTAATGSAPPRESRKPGT
jgi:hypothetical protein